MPTDRSPGTSTQDERSHGTEDGSRDSRKALELAEVVGLGTSCSLRRGCVRNSGQIVHVKTFKQKVPPQLLMDEFAAEAALLQRISHPNVARFFGARLRPPRPCLVMEAPTAGTLHRVLNNPKLYALSWHAKVQLAADTAAGLLALHEHGVVHGDVKSFTIIVNRKQATYQAKVTEFGQHRFRVPLDMTDQTDRLHRSLAWQAPERLQATHPPSPATDVYGLGVVLYELATGNVPYHDCDAYTTRQRIAEGKRPVLPPGVSEHYCRLYQACCAQNPADRPAMFLVCQALRKIMQEAGDGVQVTACNVNDGQALKPLVRVHTTAEGSTRTSNILSNKVGPMMAPIVQQPGAMLWSPRSIKMRSDSAAEQEEGRAATFGTASHPEPRALSSPPHAAAHSSLQATPKQVFSADRSTIPSTDVAVHRGQRDWPQVGSQPYECKTYSIAQLPVDPELEHLNSPLRVAKAGSPVPAIHMTATPHVPGDSEALDVLQNTPLSAAATHIATPGGSLHVLNTPHNATTDADGHAKHAQLSSSTLSAHELLKLLSTKSRRCEDKVAASAALAAMVSSQPAVTRLLLQAGVMPQLLKLLRCSHASCQQAALHAINSLCMAPDDNGIAAMRKSRLKGLLAWKVMCTAPDAALKCANSAVTRLVDENGIRILVAIIDTPQSQHPPAPLEEALACLYKISQYPAFAVDLTDYKVLRTIVNVLHRQDTEECDQLAILILTQLAEVSPTSINAGAKLGMVAVLVRRLESVSPSVAGAAAHLLAQIATTDDARVAVAKEGPVDVPVLLLGKPHATSSAAELIGALAGCNYIKQVLGTRGAIARLAGHMATTPVAVPQILTALVALCDLPAHQQMLLNAGAVDSLLHLAAGVLPSSNTAGSNNSEMAASSRASHGSLFRTKWSASSVESISHSANGQEMEGLERDKWPAVKFRAALLINMLAATLPAADGRHVLSGEDCMTWLGRALETVMEDLLPTTTALPLTKPAQALFERAAFHLAGSMRKVVQADSSSHTAMVASKAVHALVKLLEQHNMPEDARTEAAAALAVLASSNKHALLIGSQQLLCGLRDLVGQQTSMAGRRAACHLTARLAASPPVRALLVQEGMPALIVPMMQDEQAVMTCLHALLSVAETPELLVHVVDCGALPRVLSLAGARDFSGRQHALQLLVELSKNSEGRQLIVNLDGVRTLATVLHAEDYTQQYSNAAAAALSFLAADSATVEAVSEQNVIGFLVEAVQREDWLFKAVTMRALALLATQDSTNQYAVASSGVVPLLVQYLGSDHDSELRAAAANVVTALALDSQHNQEMLAARNVLSLLVDMLDVPEQDLTEGSAAEQEHMMLEAAIAAVAAMTMSKKPIQEAAREAGAIHPVVRLLTIPTCTSAVRGHAALAMANLTFDDTVKKFFTTQLSKQV